MELEMRVQFVDDTIIFTERSRRPSPVPNNFPNRRFEEWQMFLLGMNQFLHSETDTGRGGNGLSEECVLEYLKKCDLECCPRTRDQICPVCQDEIRVEEEMAVLGCSHVYHTNCIKEWLMIKNQCAVCREPAIPVAR